MKKRRDFSIVVYYVGVIALIALSIIVVLRVLFMPLCTPNTQGVCPVDGGTILSMSTSILSVAGTILTVLGAFAVAYWWINLDKRVNEQVETRINQEVNKKLQEQEKKFDAQIKSAIAKSNLLIAEAQEELRKQIEDTKH